MAGPPTGASWCCKDESAFLAVLFAFNLLSLYQRQITSEKPYRQPATLRTEVFSAGAVLGLIGK